MSKKFNLRKAGGIGVVRLRTARYMRKGMSRSKAMSKAWRSVKREQSGKKFTHSRY